MVVLTHTLSHTQAISLLKTLSYPISYGWLNAQKRAVSSLSLSKNSTVMIKQLKHLMFSERALRIGNSHATPSRQANSNKLSGTVEED